MNINNHNKTTYLTGGELLSVMEILKERYNVKTGYLNDKVLRHGHVNDLIGGGVTSFEQKCAYQQNNVFERRFEGNTTMDEIRDAIKNVCGAGKKFRDGIYKLQEERTEREKVGRQGRIDVFQ